LTPKSTAEPALSVVIPARNAAATIGEQLEALTAQVWDRSFEVTVVDNGSTDGTVALVEELARRDPRIHLEHATERTGIGYSRNVGIRASRSDAIAMCDSDDVVHPGWVAAFGDALRHVEFVTGPLDVHTLNADWLVKTRGLAIETGAGSFLGAFPFAHSCNVAFRRSLLERVGYFDETLRNGSDVELSYRIWRAGVPLHYLDDAVVSYRYRTTLRELWLQARAYGRANPELIRRFRAAGTDIEAKPSWRGWLWLVRHVGLLTSRAGRAQWVWNAGGRYGPLERKVTDRYHERFSRR
jgi:glycosyltransferase involved in cell wall biosynthesis